MPQIRTGMSASSRKTMSPHLGSWGRELGLISDVCHWCMLGTPLATGPFHLGTCVAPGSSVVKVKNERKAGVGDDSRVPHPWHGHLDAGPEGVQEEESFVIIIIAVSMGTSWGCGVSILAPKALVLKAPEATGKPKKLYPDHCSRPEVAIIPCTSQAVYH